MKSVNGRTIIMSRRRISATPMSEKNIRAIDKMYSQFYQSRVFKNEPSGGWHKDTHFYVHKEGGLADKMIDMGQLDNQNRKDCVVVGTLSTSDIVDPRGVSGFTSSDYIKIPVSPSEFSSGSGGLDNAIDRSGLFYYASQKENTPPNTISCAIGVKEVIINESESSLRKYNGSDLIEMYGSNFTQTGSSGTKSYLFSERRNNNVDVINDSSITVSQSTTAYSPQTGEIYVGAKNDVDSGSAIEPYTGGVLFAWGCFATSSTGSSSYPQPGFFDAIKLYEALLQ